MKGIKKISAQLVLLSVELVIVLLLFIISLLGFVFISNNIFRLKDTGLDTAVFSALHPFINEMNTSIMVIFTFFATPYFLLPANILLAFYFLVLNKHRWYTISVPVVSLGSFILMSSLKFFFSRPRPLNPVYEAARGFSFPSGHAMSAMTFYGLLIFLLWQNVSNRILKGLLTVLLLFIIFIIGFSRVYLRVHYASDVLAGFAMGLVWLVISLWVMRRIEIYTKKKIVPELGSDQIIQH